MPEPASPGMGQPVADRLAQVWRAEWGRLLALLVAQHRRLDLAEDALADAFETAARTWPRDGIPANPAAWLLVSARRRAVDRIRAEAVAARKEPLLVADLQAHGEASAVMADPGDLGVTDERARLLFLTCHPALAPESAGALALRLVLGVPTADIARLYLTSEATVAARITRAKRKIAAAAVPFRMPPPALLPDRVEVAARVAYLAYTAGYAAPSGPQLHDPQVAGEAVRLVQVVREVVPGQPVLDALAALVLLQHARRDARVGADGAVMLLADQDRSRWHHDEIDQGVQLLRSLEGIPLHGWAAELALQAAIAACHAVAPQAAATDWPRIAALYGELEQLTGSPVVRLNRAVAVAEADGPSAGLALLAGLESDLPRSHRVPAVAAELLARCGRRAAAAAAYDRAIALCHNEVEGDYLRRRRAELGPA